MKGNLRLTLTAILICAITVFTAAGCSKNDVTESSSGTDISVSSGGTEKTELSGITVPEEYDADSRCYRSVTVDIDYGFEGHIGDIFPAGEEVCYLVYENPSVGNVGDATNRMIFTDKRGNETRRFDLDMSVHTCSYSDGRIIAIGLMNNVCFIDAMTGDITATYTPDIPAGYYGSVAVGAITDGYVVLMQGRAMRYDLEGNETGRIEDDTLPLNYNYHFPIRTINGKIWAVDDDAVPCRYIELDFEAGMVRTEINARDMGISDISGLMETGIYSFTDFSDIYSVADPENGTFRTIAYKSNMLIEPARSSSNLFSEATPIDDDLIIVPHYYVDTSAQITYVYYDPDLDFSTRQELTIGGFGVMSDSIVERAVFNFNNSQDEYYVRTVEFIDLYPSTGEGAEAEIQRNAQIIRDFNSGNSPDIFYGDTFDYMYWGRAGIVADISDYIDLDECHVAPSIRSLMQDDDGHLYQIFGAFTVTGNFGLGSVWGEGTDFSLWDIPEPGEGCTIDGGRDSADIVYSALLYRMHDGLPDSSAMRRLVQTAYDLGTDPSTAPLAYADADGVRNGIYLMCTQYLWSATDYHGLVRTMGEIPTYIGFPSYNGSSHPIEPGGLMAVNAGASDIEACCEFMSYILSDTCQYTMLGGGFPVNSEIYDIYLDALVDRNSLPDDVADLILPFCRTFDNRTGERVDLVITQEEADAIRAMIDTVDSITVHDFGVWDIVLGEMTTIYTQDKDPDDVADSMLSRLDIFLSENEL